MALVNARGDVFEGPRPDCIRQLLNNYEFSASPMVPENFLARHPSLLDVGIITRVGNIKGALINPLLSSKNVIGGEKSFRNSENCCLVLGCQVINLKYDLPFITNIRYRSNPRNPHANVSLS